MRKAAKPVHAPKPQVHAPKPQPPWEPWTCKKLSAKVFSCAKKKKECGQRPDCVVNSNRSWGCHYCCPVDKPDCAYT